MVESGSEPAWSAVIVNYHSGPDLADCIDSLRADDSAGIVQVVVVDNGSAPGEMDALRASRPELTVLRPGANLGYARAANLGIATTRTQMVAVVNPDAVVETGTGAVMAARFAGDERIGVIGPMISNPDGTVYPSARSAPGLSVAAGHALLGSLAPRNRFTRSYRQLDADPAIAREVDWVSGAAVWFRRGALDRAGGWDERFFMFMEDVDVCRSIRATGATVWYEPAARVVHAVGTSRASAPTRSIVMHHQSAYRYTAKWASGPRRLLLPGAGTFLIARGAVGIGGAFLRRHRFSRRPELRASTR